MAGLGRVLFSLSATPPLHLTVVPRWRLGAKRHLGSGGFPILKVRVPPGPRLLHLGAPRASAASPAMELLPPQHCPVRRAQRRAARSSVALTIGMAGGSASCSKQQPRSPRTSAPSWVTPSPQAPRAVSVPQTAQGQNQPWCLFADRSCPGRRWAGDVPGCAPRSCSPPHPAPPGLTRRSP